MKVRRRRGRPRSAGVVSMKILIVEDQFRLGEFLQAALNECRYTTRWGRTSSIKQAAREHSGTRLALLGHTVHANGKPVDLTSREYALLEIFMQNQGRILPRTLISDKIWASSYDADTNLLDVYMSRLRAKLETTSGKPLFKTVRGVGYQLL